MSHGFNLVEAQIEISGRGIRQLSHDALSNIVLDLLDGERPPKGIRVSIVTWRGGKRINWRDDDQEWLRDLLRRRLQSGHVPLSIRSR